MSKQLLYPKSMDTMPSDGRYYVEFEMDYNVGKSVRKHTGIKYLTVDEINRSKNHVRFLAWSHTVLEKD